MKTYLLVGILGLALVGTVQAKNDDCSRRRNRRNRRNRRERVERVENHRQNRYVCRPSSRRNREVHVYHRNRRRCNNHRRVVHHYPRSRRQRRVVHHHYPRCRRQRQVVHVHHRPCTQRRRVEVVHTYPRPQPVEVVHTYPSQSAYDQVGYTYGHTSTPAYTTEGVQTEQVVHSPSRHKVRRRNAILIAGAANEIFNKGERRQKDIRKGAIAATILNEILTR